jgi:hypothetical protein
MLSKYFCAPLDKSKRVHNGKCSVDDRARSEFWTILSPTLPRLLWRAREQDGNKKLLADRNKVDTGWTVGET